jgi:hypothetical protein
VLAPCTVCRYLATLLDLAAESQPAAAQQQQQQQELQQLMEEHSSQQLPGSAASAGLQEQQQQQQQPTSSLQSYLLRRSLVLDWADTLLPFSSNNSSSNNSSSWWSNKQQAGSNEAAAAVTCRDVLHEVATLLLAAATWHMVKGAELASSATAEGLASATAMEAYKQQRTAAGMLQSVQQLLPQLVGWLGWDLQQQLLAGLQSLALADAQVSSSMKGFHKCYAC